MPESVVVDDTMAIRVFESIKCINNIPFSWGFKCSGKCDECPTGIDNTGIDNKCFFVELANLIEETNKEMVRKKWFRGDE